MKAPLVKRAVQLGLLSKDLAQLRWTENGNSRESALDRIVDRLGRMHGLPQKIGQILSFGELAESDGKFSQLTENATPLDGEVALAEIATQITSIESKDERNQGKSGKTLSPVQVASTFARHFESFDPKGIAASLGQVHRAQLRSGAEVAIKIQYPDVANQLEADLRAIGWLSAPLGDLRRGFDLQGYRREVGSMLKQELDYHREADWIRRFGEWVRPWPVLEVPRVIDELSGERLLTMSWVAGERFSSACQWLEQERKRIAETLLDFFLHCCFERRCIHADPHSGNYRFRREEESVRIGLLDFGCVKELDDSFVGGLYGLIRDGADGVLTDDKAWDWHMRMGFEPSALEPIRSDLGGLCTVLFEPFVIRGPFDAGQWNLGARIASLLGANRLNYRIAGPPGMIYLVRALQGLIQYLRTLDVRIDWREAFDRISFGGGRKGATENPQSLAPSQAALYPNRPMKSELLRIRVTESGQTRVDLTFGAAALDNLGSLIPQHLLPKLADRSIRIEEIVACAQRSDYAPAQLFSLEDENKRVTVWLE